MDEKWGDHNVVRTDTKNSPHNNYGGQKTKRPLTGKIGGCCCHRCEGDAGSMERKSFTADRGGGLLKVGGNNIQKRTECIIYNELNNSYISYKIQLHLQCIIRSMNESNN